MLSFLEPFRTLPYKVLVGDVSRIAFCVRGGPFFHSFQAYLTVRVDSEFSIFWVCS